MIPLSFIPIEDAQAAVLRKWAQEAGAGIAVQVLRAHAARGAVEAGEGMAAELLDPGSDKSAAEKAAEACFYHRAANVLEGMGDAESETELELIRVVPKNE